MIQKKRTLQFAFFVKTKINAELSITIECFIFR